jgi:hypothetical protein
MHGRLKKRCFIAGASTNKLFFESEWGKISPTQLSAEIRSNMPDAISPQEMKVFKAFP